MNNNIDTAREFLRLPENENRDILQLLVSYVDYLHKEDSRSLEDRKQAFIDTVRPYVEEMGTSNANDFCKYWLQITPRGRKYKFEKEKTWNTKLRIGTWMRNVEKSKIVSMLRR